MFKKIRNNIGVIILITILGLVLLGATYVNLGPTSLIDGDIGVTAGHGYYIGDTLLSITNITVPDESIPEAKLDIDNSPADEYVLTWEADSGKMHWQEETGGGASTFVALTDTPANYTDQAGKYIKVNAGETALEFGTPAGGGTYLELTDTPAAYDNGKYAKSTADGVIWDIPSGGYTNLTSFVDQTAWQLFYSNADGDVIELALGVDGTYLRSNGATSAPTFGTPTGAGDMLKATYDTDTDNIVDKAETVDDGVGNSSTAIDIKDAVTKKHSQNTDTQFDFYNTLASDHTYSGLTDSQPVGESVIFGDLLYFNWTDKEWKKAIASAYATAKAERIALETKADGETCLMLIKGYIRDDSAFDFGASVIFLNDDTAGTCDDTAPAESGDQIQVVGTAKSADILFFNPSIDVGEI